MTATAELKKPEKKEVVWTKEERDTLKEKYGSEIKMNEIHHYETYEIRDNNDRLILPPDLKVDVDFKIDGK